jgi:enoyl-CoA hydratase
VAGGTELATACDLVYIAQDAQVGYPPVRLMSPPDLAWQPWLRGLRRGMEAMLTGDAMSGTEAVEAGFANRAFPAEELDERMLEIAARIAKIPPDLLALNKRVVHRAMEAAGIRTGLRATADIQALGHHQPGARAYWDRLGEVDLKQALDERDMPFGDYRTSPG